MSSLSVGLLPTVVACQDRGKREKKNEQVPHARWSRPSLSRVYFSVGVLAVPLAWSSSRLQRKREEVETDEVCAVNQLPLCSSRRNGSSWPHRWRPSGVLPPRDGTGGRETDEGRFSASLQGNGSRLCIWKVCLSFQPSWAFRDRGAPPVVSTTYLCLCMSRRVSKMCMQRLDRLRAKRQSCVLWLPCWRKEEKILLFPRRENPRVHSCNTRACFLSLLFFRYTCEVLRPGFLPYLLVFLLSGFVDDVPAPSLFSLLFAAGFLGGPLSLAAASALFSLGLLYTFLLLLFLSSEVLGVFFSVLLYVSLCSLFFLFFHCPSPRGIVQEVPGEGGLQEDERSGRRSGGEGYVFVA